jgi:hypothetical protein
MLFLRDNKWQAQLTGYQVPQGRTENLGQLHFIKGQSTEISSGV